MLKCGDGVFSLLLNLSTFYLEEKLYSTRAPRIEMPNNCIFTVGCLFRIHNMPGTVIMIQTFMILGGLKSASVLYDLAGSSPMPLMEAGPRWPDPFHR